MFKYHTIALISFTGKVMLKNLQPRLQLYINQELWDVQAGFRKGRGNRYQVVNISWIIEKAKEFPKKIYFCFTDYGKAFDCVEHKKLWKILKQMGIPDPLTWLLRNLYAGQEYEKITLQIFLKAENDKEKLQLIEVVLSDSNFQLTKSFIVKGLKKKRKKEKMKEWDIFK